MTKEERNNSELLEIMELIELVDLSLRMDAHIQDISFEDVTPEIWDAVHESRPLNTALLERLKESLSIGSKIIDNDAVRSHLETVLLTDV